MTVHAMTKTMSSSRLSPRHHVSALRRGAPLARLFDDHLAHPESSRMAT